MAEFCPIFQEGHKTGKALREKVTAKVQRARRLQGNQTSARPLPPAAVGWARATTFRMSIAGTDWHFLASTPRPRCQVSHCQVAAAQRPAERQGTTSQP